MFKRHVGIDLGTANVLVYVKGKGVVLNEPAVVALAANDSKIVAVGTEAREMIGRTPGHINVVRPLKDGVIADYLITEAMLRHFISKVCGRMRMVKPEVMICVPAGVTSVELRAVKEAAEQAGAKKPVHLIPEPLAAAIGARMPLASPGGNLVVDIGGGTTEAAVISMYGLVVSRSVRVAGNRIDEAITNFVKRKFGLIIGERTAEEIKIVIGSVIPMEEERRMEVRGRDQVSGLPRTITITSTGVTQAIAEPVSQIVAAVKAVLEQTPPELASDVIDRGIMLTGGGALLRGLDRLLAQETGVACHSAEDPLSCVAVGAGLALENLNLLKGSLQEEE